MFWVVFTRKSIKTQKQCPEDKADLRDRSRYGEGLDAAKWDPERRNHFGKSFQAIKWAQTLLI